MTKLFPLFAIFSLAACESFSGFAAETAAENPDVPGQLGSVVGNAVEQAAGGADLGTVVVGAGASVLAIVTGVLGKKLHDAKKANQQ